MFWDECINLKDYINKDNINVQATCDAEDKNTYDRNRMSSPFYMSYYQLDSWVVGCICLHNSTLLIFEVF